MTRTDRIQTATGILTASVLIAASYVPVGVARTIEETAKGLASTPPVVALARPIQPETVAMNTPAVPTLLECWEDLIDSIIEVESGGDPKAVSPCGARGLMQLREPAWRQMTGASFDDAFDPKMNRMIGTEYVRWLWRSALPENHRTLVDILAAYNGGIGRYKRAGYDLERMPEETRAYVGKVYAALERRIDGGGR